VQSQAEGAIAAWREPDQGIWEAPGKPQHYVSSKLMGWVVLDRAAKLARSAARPSSSRHGPRPPRSSEPTSLLTASATAASYASITTPPRPTPPRCSPPCSASSRMRRADENTVDAISSELSGMASCCATSPARRMTAYPGRKAPSLPAASGWCPRSPSSARCGERPTSWNASCESPHPSGSTQKNSKSSAPATSAVSPKPSPTFALSAAAGRIILADRLEEWTGWTGPTPWPIGVHIRDGGRPASHASERLGDEQIDGREQGLGDVMLVDRDDYHQSQPLLYQVASSGFPPRTAPGCIG
jgi:hypothetical protein